MKFPTSSTLLLTISLLSLTRAQDYPDYYDGIDDDYALSTPGLPGGESANQLELDQFRSLFPDNLSKSGTSSPSRQEEHLTGFEEDVDAAAGEGLPRKESPFLRGWRDQFAAPSSDPSTTLYSHFRKLALSPNSTTGYITPASSYTVTQSPTFQLLQFSLSDAASSILKLRPIQADGGDEETLVTKTIFRESGRKRDGEGSVGREVDFAGWEVWWRGMEFEVWQATWWEASQYRYITQYHLLTRTPSNAFPFPLLNPSTATTPLPQSLLEATGTTAVVESAPLAADLLILEVSAWAVKVRDAILVFDQGWWRPDYGLYASVQKADWNKVILSPSFKSQIQHEYRSFFTSETVYRNLGVSWKRGLIWYGPPGTGKTFSLKAVMKDVLNGVGVGREEKSVLYVKSFHTYAGDEAGIRQIFQKARQSSPCLLVFEDLDSLITDGNRAFFLNEVDGLEDNDGLLLLATTNHFDRLDPALSNRPSRFDRKYLFPNPSPSERTLYAQYWQTKLKDNDRIEFGDEVVKVFVKRTEGFSFAYMQEAFVSTLLILAGDDSQKLLFKDVLLSQVKALREELDANKPKYQVHGHGHVSPDRYGNHDRQGSSSGYAGHRSGGGEGRGRGRKSSWMDWGVWEGILRQGPVLGM